MMVWCVCVCVCACMNKPDRMIALANSTKTTFSMYIGATEKEKSVNGGGKKEEEDHPPLSLGETKHTHRGT